MKKKIITAVLLLALFLLCIAAFDARLKTVTYRIDAPQLDAPIRLALVTDLHSSGYGEGQSQLLAAIAAQQPDAVLLGGDIFDDVVPNENAETFVRRIAEEYRCFYVTGNHEYWSGEVGEMLTFLRSCGVTVLSGDCVTLEANGEMVNLCGVDDPDAALYAAPAQGFAGQLAAASEAAASNGAYTVLLSHRPEHIEQYAAEGFDLVLSGHAHGGQWRLPGLVNGLFAPNQGLFPRYAGGQYQQGGTAMIVSRGLDRESIKLPRIFNRPELVIVEIA